MTQAAPNFFESRVSENEIKNENEVPEEMLGLHECVVCVTQNQESYDIYNMYTIAGISLYNFLSKFINTDNIMSGNFTVHICKRCLHLVNVLEQAEMEYMRAKADFDSIISKNPFLRMPQPIQECVKGEPVFSVFSHNKCASESLSDDKKNESSLVVKTEVTEDCSDPYMKAPPCPTPGCSKTPGRQLQDAQIDTSLNCGSDMDSDEDEDEDVGYVPMGPARTVSILLDTPTDPELPASSPVLPPNDQPTWMSDPMYKFQWLSHPNPPVPPESRREPFTVEKVGPTVPDMSPEELFKHIWDVDIMSRIATETNRYAEQLAAQMMEQNILRPSSRICKWKDTNPDELYVFFGIILAMGVVIKRRLNEYWSTSDDIFVTPGFNANMSLRRFQLLCTCLHFNDNSQMQRNIKVSEARLFKIIPVLDHLNRKFQTMYNMGQNIALDESLLQWRGWLQISQMITTKTATKILKTCEICEPHTGYLWRFIVHTQGQGPRPTPQQDPLSSFTPSLVINILKGLEHKGYTVWIDNYYNSPPLARKLKSLGFDCVGTLRTNREFVPAEISELQKYHMRQGQVAGVTSGDVDLMVWRDQNRVATISTYHGNTVTTDNDGNTKPVLIRDYAMIMSGVDKKDQHLSSYPIERNRGRVWYKKFFRRLLNVSVLNAYVIHKQQHRERSLEHTDFRKNLIKSLLSIGDSRSIPSIPPAFDVRYHYLEEYPFGASKGRLRRMCVVCKARSTMFCVGCKKTVCLACFPRLHV